LPNGHLIFSVATRTVRPCRSVRNGILCKIRWSTRDLTSYSSTPFSFGIGTRELYFREQTSDETVIKQVLMQQQYDLRRLRRAPELLSFVQRQQERGLRPLVIDAGANIGASAIYFAGNLPKALVIAIEPDLENFTLLCKNVEGLSVEPVHGAISSAAGHARVYDPGQGHWGYRTQPTAEHDAADAVARVTINDIYRSHEPFFPFMAKIDIEGAEQDLFSDSIEWIALTPLLIVELHDWLLPKGRTSRPFLECISKLDRDFVSIGEDIYSIANDLDALAA
jgi:FkbM family methyltransferase